MPDALTVADTARYPYSAIARVVATYDSGVSMFGGGAVIGPNDVLTARHLVEDDPVLGRVASVEVIPGAQGRAAPFGAFFASEWRWIPRFNDGSGKLYPGEAATDYALLTVESPAPIGAETGWFGYASPGLAPGETLSLNTAGYPIGPQLVDIARTPPQMIRRHDADPFDGLVLAHDEFSETGVFGGGGSGSPFWTWRDGVRTVVAVLSTADWAAYITPQAEAQIRAWAQENGDGGVSEAGPAGVAREGPGLGDAGAQTAEIPLRPENADLTLFGGADDDRLTSAAGGSAAIDAGGGADIVKTGSGSDWIDAGAGDDIALSRAGDDFVFAGDGDDTIKTHTGHDVIDAGAGDDVVLSGDGDDLIFGGDGRDTIKPGRGADTVLGGDGDDVIMGFRGDEFLDGGPGDDTIRGGLDDDTLLGGPGDDRLVGGPGRDVFLFGPAEIGFDAEGTAIARPAAFGRDRIVDFWIGSDALDFSGSGVTRADLAFAQIDGKAVLHVPASGATLVIASIGLADLREGWDESIFF